MLSSSAYWLSRPASSCMFSGDMGLLLFTLFCRARPPSWHTMQCEDGVTLSVQPTIGSAVIGHPNYMGIAHVGGQCSTAGLNFGQPLALRLLTPTGVGQDCCTDQLI